ncbi:MAG: cupredoxin domain-containing protein [Thaumarchaeota archaeon]|nr:cupredoxin domain-containing protein [Nitrososphaerota archaeon]
MKFRWYYVSMGATAAVVLGSMMFLGPTLCIPVEQMPCTSFLPVEGQMVKAAPPDNNPVTAPAAAAPSTTQTSTVPPGTGGTVPANGNKVDYTLSFQISSDFSKYGFNSTIGSLGANPDITVHSGDTVTVHLSNPSKSFHAFGVVIDQQNPSTVLWNSAFKTPDNPMKPGESGQVTFVAGTPGLYHYICTVPGHAELGMDGNFIVKK